LTLALPPQDAAIQWLDQCGVPRPEVMLAAAGGQPLEARDWAQQGVDAALWAELPQMIVRGEAGPLADWPPERLVDALQKLCHDALCRACGAPTRYYGADSVPPWASLRALCDWARELQRCAAHIEHPWNAGLMAESLVLKGRMALATGHAPSARRRSNSLHSRA
jgi:DNA polymerase-3 subunit delta'